MRRTRSTTALLLPLLWLAACTDQGEPAPVLGSIAPAHAPTDVSTTVSIRGENFRSQVKVDFDAPADSQVNSTFDLWLVAGDVRVPLAEVSLVSDTELSAQYLGLTADPGVYHLELLDPAGHRALLPEAFTVATSGCRGAWDGTPCLDGDHCTGGETCQRGLCKNPTSVVTCASGDDCVRHASCKRSTGQCVEILKRDGTACTSAGSCVAGQACRAGVCACVMPP